jgi:hypothetical protein
MAFDKLKILAAKEAQRRLLDGLESTMDVIQAIRNLRAEEGKDEHFTDEIENRLKRTFQHLRKGLEWVDGLAEK